VVCSCCEIANGVKVIPTNAVAALYERDVDVHIIIGDNERTARAVDAQAGIHTTNGLGGVLPEDKGDAVEAIHAGGLRLNMVGDGVNDAPVLATTYVGTNRLRRRRRHRGRRRDTNARRPAGHREGNPGF